MLNASRFFSHPQGCGPLRLPVTQALETSPDLETTCGFIESAVEQLRDLIGFSEKAMQGVKNDVFFGAQRSLQRQRYLEVISVQVAQTVGELQAIFCRPLSTVQRLPLTHG